MASRSYVPGSRLRGDQLTFHSWPEVLSGDPGLAVVPLPLLLPAPSAAGAGYLVSASLARSFLVARNNVFFAVSSVVESISPMVLNLKP